MANLPSHTALVLKNRVRWQRSVPHEMRGLFATRVARTRATRFSGTKPGFATLWTMDHPPGEFAGSTHAPHHDVVSAKTLTDAQIVARVCAGETLLFELLMRRHNRQVFRAARAILKRDDEAEDVMQDAYVRAYANLASFKGEASFSTWLTRIAVHEALARARRERRFVCADAQGGACGADATEAGASPEAQVSTG